MFFLTFYLQIIAQNSDFPLSLFDVENELKDKKNIEREQVDSVFCLGFSFSLKEPKSFDTIYHASVHFDTSGRPIFEQAITRSAWESTTHYKHLNDSLTIKQVVVNGKIHSEFEKLRYDELLVNDKLRSSSLFIPNKSGDLILLKERDTLIYKDGKLSKMIEFWYDSMGKFDSLTNLYTYDKRGNIEEIEKIISPTFFNSIELENYDFTKISHTYNRKYQYHYGLSDNDRSLLFKQNQNSKIQIETGPLVDTMIFGNFRLYKNLYSGESSYLSEFEFAYNKDNLLYQLENFDLKRTEYLENTNLPQRIVILKDDSVENYTFTYFKKKE